jgi:hypothetical protein
MILMSSPKPKDKWGYVYKPPIHCYITTWIMVHGHVDVCTKKNCKPLREYTHNLLLFVWFHVTYYGLFANLLVCSLREREWERERLGYGFSINNWNAHVAPCKKHASVFVVNFCTLHIYSTCRSLLLSFHFIVSVLPTRVSCIYTIELMIYNLPLVHIFL